MARGPVLTWLTAALALVMTMRVDAQAVLETGWSCEGHVVVLGLDSDRVYLGVSRPGVTLDQALRESWTVHSAPRTGGERSLEHLRPRNVQAWEELQDIQHVAMHPRGRKALISARRHGGDFDVFLSHRTPSRVPGGRDMWSSPLPLDGLNSAADDVFPQWQGQDISFASNRSGTFLLFQARAALQYLRAEPHPLEVPGEVLSAVTVGPGCTWVARRLSEDQAMEVVRVSWPEPERPLAEGWTLCMGGAAGQVTVRGVESRAKIRTMTLDEHGCVSLRGLPSGQAWTFEWEGGGAGITAMAEITSPEGRVVRRYALNPENGFAFVLLPLDAVAALENMGSLDGSDWPKSTLAILSYERGLPTPTSDSWRVFQGWAQGLQGQSERGILRVTGHTDASGTDDLNAALSLARAEYVATQLQSLVKWPKERVEVEALGSSEPLGNNPAQNRRVEVRWVRSLQ